MYFQHCKTENEVRKTYRTLVILTFFHRFKIPGCHIVMCNWYFKSIRRP